MEPDTPNEAGSVPERAAIDAAAERAPGAIPPTDGVPPEEGAPVGPRSESSAADDLADGLDLMVRAARKALRSLDPRLEQTAERALKQLQELDRNTFDEFSKLGRIDPKKIEQAAEEAGREIAAVVERVSQRIDTLFARKPRE